MALRVLTSEEKEALVQHAAYQSACVWAIRDYATYWSVHDGGSLDAAGRIKWAKDRMLSVPILIGDVNDPTVPLQFAKLAKGIQLDLAAAPVSSSVITAALLAGNKFEELASLYFNLLGENINFSLGGS